MTVYSHSRLSTYENCPLKYKYNYIDKIRLEPEITGIEAFMGIRVHETLEKLYRDLNVSKENPLEGLLGYYDHSWEREWSENVRIVKEEYSAENYKDTGRKCVANYYNRYAPFDQSRTLLLERVIFIDLGGYRLRGFIDRLAEAEGGHYEIHDYKASQYLPVQKHFDEDRQLALYQIGVKDRWDDVKDVDLIWHYLVFNKEIKSKRSEEGIERLKADTITLIQQIEAAEDEDNFQPRESALCKWCEYQPICPRHRHLFETEGLPPNEFLSEPGVKLVNEYARLTDEKNAYLTQVEDKLERLKEAIIAFAKREGVEVMRGSDRKLSVKMRTVPKFPTKKDPARPELDALLRQSGKWMEVSDLNTHTLARMLRDGGWSPELVEQIKRYQALEDSYRLTLSQLHEDTRERVS